MRSSFIGINILFSLIIIISIQITISLLDFTYPSAISLTNGNIFVVEKNGIFVYDSQLKNIVDNHNYPFEDEDKINDLDILSNVIIKFKANYIICLINSKIYFFDYGGKFILKTEKLITEQTYYYPTLTPITLNIENLYYYVIAYFIDDGGSYKIKLLYYKINFSEKTNTNLNILTVDNNAISSWFIFTRYYFENMGLSCEYMQELLNDADNFLVCFFVLKKGDTYSLSQNYFAATSDSLSISNMYNPTLYDNIKDVTQIQSVTSNSRKNALVCLLFTDNSLKCHKFHYKYQYFMKSVEFYGEEETNLFCRNVLYGMKLKYLVGAQKISLSCINDISTVQALFFDDNLDLLNSEPNEQFTQCESIYSHSIIQKNSVYYIISDVICENYKRSYKLLDGPLSPIEIITNTQCMENNSEEEEEAYLDEEIIEGFEHEKEIEILVEEVIEEKYEEKEECIKEEIIEDKIEEIIEDLSKEKEMNDEEKIEEEIKEEKKKETEEEIEEEMKEEIKKELIKEEEKTEISKPQFDCNNLEKCKECGQESLNNNLCLNCNNENNYYYLNNNPSGQRSKYIDCVNNKTKPSNFYFNKKNSDYEPCFTTCASCEYGGNYEENNCTSCDRIYFIKNPENENSSNCLIKCKYFYYFQRDIYTCTEIPFCPEQYSYLIKDKFKCTNNCLNDKEYKFRYNGECFKKCPNNTLDDNDYICKDIPTSEWVLTESEMNFLNEDTHFDDIEKLVNKYIYEFNYTDSHVSLYKNGDYTITIYIKNKCILELGIGLPEIDFGICYEKIKNSEESINGELIISIIDKEDKSKNTKKIIKYGIFSPLTGKYLNSDEICKEDKIMIVDSIEDKLLEAKVNLQVLKELVSEGIDIFNLSSPFYNDICFQYNSKKDIALKDRVLEYFPNITLCEEGCDLMGINMTTITAICECYYSESKREDVLKDKVLDQAQISFIEDIISSSNIYVIKCINLVLSTKSIKKCYGGFFILCLMIIEIIYVIIYCTKDINAINKYIFCITNKYINYLIKQKQNKIGNKSNIKSKSNIISFENNDKINAPPKQNKKISYGGKDFEARIITRRLLMSRRVTNKAHNNIIIYNNKNENIQINDKNDLINKNPISTNNKILNSNDEGYPNTFQQKNFGENSNLSGKDFISEQKSDNTNIKDNLFLNTNDDLDINIEEYIKTQFDDMDYDDAIRKDKRKFCESYVTKIKDKQIIINTFFSYEPTTPKSIKIIFLILQVDLYFFINGMFYDEEYISNIYHLEKDTFFTMAERFFDNLIYAALAGIIINYIIEFFFVEEQKIKRIFKMEQDNIVFLKQEIMQLLKSIKIRYILFIIISFIISLIALVHIFCFNIVYYHTMTEWIVFSLIIILSIQIGSFLILLLQTALRFISFKFKSEKLFKLSL